MSDLAGLIERLEKLNGPDREADAYLHAFAVGGRIHSISDGETIIERPIDGLWVRNVLPLKTRKIAPYTASLDAAIALVEKVLPGAYREMTGPRKYLNIPTPVPARFRAEILHDDGTAVAWHDREPIALLLALLHALQSGGSHDR